MVNFDPWGSTAIGQHGVVQASVMEWSWRWPRRGNERTYAELARRHNRALGGFGCGRGTPVRIIQWPPWSPNGTLGGHDLEPTDSQTEKSKSDILGGPTGSIERCVRRRGGGGGVSGPPWAWYRQSRTPQTDSDGSGDTQSSGHNSRISDTLDRKRLLPTTPFRRFEIHHRLGASTLINEDFRCFKFRHEISSTNTEWPEKVFLSSNTILVACFHLSSFLVIGHWMLQEIARKSLICNHCWSITKSTIDGWRPEQDSRRNSDYTSNFRWCMFHHDWRIDKGIFSAQHGMHLHNFILDILFQFSFYHKSESPWMKSFWWQCSTWAPLLIVNQYGTPCPEWVLVSAICWMNWDPGILSCHQSKKRKHKNTCP